MSRKFISLIVILLLALSASHFMTDNLFAGDISVLFSPKDECGKVILDKINRAEESIELAMYYLTSRVLSRALVSASKRGVQVRVFLDGEGVQEQYSKAGFLKKNGILVKLENGVGLMHNKFCIIDNALVITGSYNWTVSADTRNDENIILIDSKETVRAYRIQFEKYWQGSYIDKAYYINKHTLQKAGSRF
jgi:phosphatidylserine/phosphatidylglycerophosphate/cardiolipin synthase-like enzyme